MKKVLLSNVLDYVIFALCIGVGSFLANGERLFGDQPNALLTFKEVIFSFVFLLLSVACLIFLSIKKKKFKPNLILISLLGILFITNLIALLTFKDYGVYNYAGIDGEPCSFEYSISASLRATFILESAALLITAYIIFDVTYQLFKLDQLLKVICIFVIGLDLAFMLISYISEFQKYLDLIPSFFNGQYLDGVKSVFMSKNNYALILTLSFVSLIFLHHFYGKWYYAAGAGFIYINVFFTMCKLLLIIDFVFAVFYFIYWVIMNFKNEPLKRRNILIVSSTVVIVPVSSLLIVLAVTNHFDSLFRQDGFNTFETRSWIWRRSIEAIGTGNWFTGVGHNLFGEILFRLNTYDVTTQFANNTRFAHNAALEALGNGGLALLFVGLAIFSMLIIMAIKNIKNNRDLSMISFALFVLFTVYMAFESASFIMPKSLETVIYSLLIAIPIISEYKYAVK